MRHNTPLLTIFTIMELKVELLQSEFSDIGSLSGGEAVTGSVGSTYMVGNEGG